MLFKNTKEYKDMIAKLIKENEELRSKQSGEELEKLDEELLKLVNENRNLKSQVKKLENEPLEQPEGKEQKEKRTEEEILREYLKEI